MHEACMLCMGSVRNLVIETVKSGSVQFDVSGFLESVVLADMNATGKFVLISSPEPKAQR